MKNLTLFGAFAVLLAGSVFAQVPDTPAGRQFSAWRKAQDSGDRDTIQQFIDKNVDIGPIKNVKPRFAPPAAVDGKGVLVVAGHYPIPPSLVRSELKYVQVRSGWKLMGLSVKVGKENPPE